MSACTCPPSYTTNAVHLYPCPLYAGPRHEFMFSTGSEVTPSETEQRRAFGQLEEAVRIAARHLDATQLRSAVTNVIAERRLMLDTKDAK